MKIAIVFPVPWLPDDPTRSSIDLQLYVHAASDLGHEACIICPGDDRAQVGHLQTVSEQSLRSVEFWSAQGFDLAVAFTWLKHADILEAIKRSGTFVCSRADSDGRVSIRLWPLEFLKHAWVSQRGVWNKVKGARWWLYRWLFLAPEYAWETLSSLDAADVVVVETEGARQGVLRFLVSQSRQDLFDKVLTLPHVVGARFLDIPPTEIVKRRKIVAIGRWDSPQKDGPLLARALERFLSRRPEVEVTLIGPGEAIFEALCERFPAVKRLGALPREAVAGHLVDSRIIVFSSRWEGSPIAANEALAVGTSIVGPNLPSLGSICAAGPFGTITARRRAAELAAALEAEMTNWDEGRRGVEVICAAWRPRLSGTHFLQTVISKMPVAKCRSSPAIGLRTPGS